MGKRVIQFDLDENENPVYIEIEDPGYGGIEQAGLEDTIEKAQNKFVEAIERVKPAAEAVLNSFREMNTPDEIGLEFGIAFKANAGAVFASVASDATFKVSLKWKNEKKSG
ncbi:MAG: hypothetical protein GY749_27635 [Desulfobacteraceae bacterium]|nr:hypothetical protein [Desulfobacteraceae bacterium]